ncbi:T9SS type B sorting domain-containing protein [Chishuiella sp.]|uniref:T9SS type B sorting domain-containing protein n=1 Tax=Chishuiella sp. TaxID=1969467 RepID=UPI0028AC73DD|nr:T9SS type B sorting domain-containing protein [Chishuiella sp.]
MKKIFYFLLLLLNSFAYGQIGSFNNLCGNNSNLTLNNTYFTYKFKTATGCSQDLNDSYKSINYYKVVTDGTFKFTLQANGLVNYHVWVLTDNQLNNFFLNEESRYDAIRSSYSSVTTEKGLFDSATDECEFYGTADGKLKPITVTAGQYIVIGVLGANQNITFSITPGGTATVCEPEPNRGTVSYSNLCLNNTILLSTIKSDVKSKIATEYSDSSINVSNIKIYQNETSSSEITNDITSSVGGNIQLNQTYIAKVFDNAGKLKYIYTIPIQFIAEHIFNFKSSFATEYACTTTFTVPNQSILLSQLFDTVDSNYTISSISINGNSYNSGDNVTLSAGEETAIKVKVNYGGSCPIISEEKSIPLKQGKPTLSSGSSDTTCNSSYTINFDTIYSKLGVDKNQFDLIVTLGGNSIYDGSSNSIAVGTPLEYQVKIVSKSSSCESDPVNFTVTRTSPANIVNASISGICLDDFSQTNVDTAINTIQNGSAYQLRFYQADGTTEIAITELANYIRTNKNGQIIVKALASDNSNTICDTSVNLTFALNQSSFVKVDNIANYNSTCSAVGAGFTFTKTAIETYLKSKLGNNIAAFSGISDVTLSDDQSTTISFKIQLNGESCWSDEMQLKLQVITKPNVSDTTTTLQADCNNLIIINQSVLNDLFGSASTTNYDYEILHNNSTALTFDSSGKAKISVLFKNKIDNTCFVEKIITVTKKPGLVVDAASLNSYNQSHEIVFCADDETGAKNQIQTLLDYIKTQYATLESLSTVDEIFAKIGLGQGNTSITFEDPNYCGQVDIKFYYQQNELPPITVPEKGYVCTGELYVLDFTSQTNYNDYTYIVEKANGTRVTGIDKYDLEIGTYKVTIENKSTGCSIVKTLVVENSPVPTIEKIVINQKSIIVSAKGSGVLQYALYDNSGNVIINWQRSNTLIIPANLTNSNFVVKVSLDNCGISEESDIIYLDLPNVITPNGDGKNDLWKPMTKNGQANDITHSYKLIIFDRYGRQIISKEGINIIEWDGTQNGIILPDDSYWYLLESSKRTGVIKVQYSGSILLKRKI